MSTQASPTDLTGLFKIQKDYLLRLVQDSNDGNEVGDLNKKLTTIQDQLDKLYTDFKEKNISSTAVLDKQRETSLIINDEKARLEEKKQGIDNALIGKQRAVALNDSYRLKLTQITRIKITIVITLAICILLILLGRRYPAFPSIIITLLILIAVAVGTIYSLFLYSEISSRSKINYNELDLGGPKILSPEEEAAAQVSAGKAGNLLGTINPQGCVGSDCCSKDTVWDKIKSKCVLPSTVDVSQSLPGTGGKQPFTTMNSTGYVNSPTEYDKYGRV